MRATLVYEFARATSAVTSFRTSSSFPKEMLRAGQETVKQDELFRAKFA
jgi:hypothetical protein